MKKTGIQLALLGLVIIAAPIVETACTQTASTQQVEYKTLATVGLTAKTAMDAASSLLAQKKITVAQYQTIASFYDTKFQPAYKVAVQAARSDLSTIASPDVANLAIKLASLVTTLTQ